MQRLTVRALASWLGLWMLACSAHAPGENQQPLAAQAAEAGSGGIAAAGSNGTAAAGSSAAAATSCAPADQAKDVLGIATAPANAAAPLQLRELTELSGEGLSRTLMNQQVGPAGLRWAGDRMFLLTDTGFWEIPSTGPARWYATATTLINGVAAGDLDGDGDRDLLLMTSVLDPMAMPSPLVTRLAVWERTAEGLVERSEVLRASGFALPMPYELGDMDGDGDLDIVTYEHGAPVAYVNGGAFAFAREVRGESAAEYQNKLVGAVHLADRNGDGAQDLLVLAGEMLDVAAFVLLGDGQGRFGAPGPAAPAKASLVPHGPAGNGFGIADVTGDGIADVLEQDPTGTDSAPRLLLYASADATTWAPVSVLDALGFELADVDKDAVLDIVTTRAQRLFVLLARGHGDFEARDLGVDMDTKTLRDFVVDPGQGSAVAQIYTLNELTRCADCSSHCAGRCVFGACVQCLSDADCEHARCVGRSCVP